MQANSNPPNSRKYGRYAGYVVVDSGLCWVGDPCRVLHTKKPRAIGKTWEEFIDPMSEFKMVPIKTHGKTIKIPTNAPVNARQYGEGTGVCVQTGVGDGIYPVFVKEGKVGGGAKRVKAVTVLFIEQ